MLAAQVYERRYSMDGETNGGQEATQGAQDQTQQQGQEQQETQQQGRSQVDSTSDHEKQIAERDEKIASLEAQVAEAAKSAETAEQLRAEAELSRRGLYSWVADIRSRIEIARAVARDEADFRSLLS